MEEVSKPLVIRKRVASVEKTTAATVAPVACNKDEVIETVRKQLESFLHLLVDHPTEVKISVEQGERTTIFKIDCTQRNLGKVLGCKGKMITSLRNMALAVTARHGFRSIIEVPYYANANAVAESECKELKTAF